MDPELRDLVKQIVGTLFVWALCIVGIIGILVLLHIVVPS
jgi:hypothetical protein